MDDDNFSFRHKVKMQFNLLSNGANTSKKSKTIAKLALILSLSPLILEKFPKKINAIFKYFKRSSKNIEKKSYA